MAEIVIKLFNGKEAGKTMQELGQQANAAATALKKAEIGTEAWVNASKQLESIKQRQGDVKKQLEATTAASYTLKDAWNKLPGAQFFNQIGESFKMAKQGVGGLVTSMGALKTAIIATGVGALVIAVMALFTWFTKTEAGGDLLAKAMNVVNAVFRQITESVSRLMSGDLIGFFKGVTTEMVEQTKAATKLADTIDALEEKESAFQVVQRAGLRDKAELLKMSKEEDRSLEERIKAIDQAMTITKNLNAQELENQREHLKIISGGTAEITDEMIKRFEASGLTMENAKEFFQKGNITQADLDEANGAMGKFLDIQADAYNEQRELLTQRNKLNSKDRTAERAEISSAQKQELEELRVQNDAKENLRKLDNERRLGAIQDAHKKEIEKINQDAQEKILTLNGTEQQIADQTAAIREIQGQQLAEIDEKYRQKKNDDDKEATEKAYQEKLVANELEILDEINFLNEKYLAKAITEEQFTLQAQAIALENATKKLEIIRIGLGTESAEYKKQLAVLLGLQKASADASKLIAVQLTNDNAEALVGSLNVFGNLFGSLAQLYAQGTAEWKAFATAQAIISTIQGGINAYTSTQAIPVLGPILAPIAALAALAAGYARVREIQAVKIPTPAAKKGRKGGVFNGPSHEEGGIPIEVEGDEIIMTRGVYRNPGLRSMASALNVAGGGRSFATGGPTNPFDASRGPVKSTGVPGTSAPDPFARLEAAILGQTAAINQRIDRIQVVNNLQDTEKGLKTLNTLRYEADL